MAKIASPQAKNTSARRDGQAQTSIWAAEIEQLAYDFFVERGYEHGHDREDWLRAEAVIKNRKKS